MDIHKRVSLNVPLVLHDVFISDDIWDPFDLSEEEFIYISAGKTSEFNLVSDGRPPGDELGVTIQIDLYLDGTLQV